MVEEEDNREIGGIFATLLAALDFVDGESRRFQVAQAVIELSPREPAARRDAASARALPH